MILRLKLFGMPAAGRHDLTRRIFLMENARPGSIFADREGSLGMRSVEAFRP
jgi:hypothetical protein